MNKPLPPPVAEAFTRLARAQRGAPEDAKDEPHRLLSGGGVMLPWLTEHVGDLTHRMAEHGGMAGGYTKVTDALYWLRQPGSPRDFAAGLARDVERMAAHRGPGLRRALDTALAVYADAHRKLRVYNQAQFAAREAAVALGEQRWADAVTMLEYLEGLTQDGTWEAAVREYRLAPDGSVMEFPWAAQTPNARRFSVAVRFKVFKSTGEVAVNVQAKNQEVGYLLLWDIGSHTIGRCEEAVSALQAEIFGGGDVPIWRVGDVQLEPEHRNQGIGLLMYEKALAAIRPGILISGACTGMGTTREALRIWQSLAKRYPCRGSDQTLALAVP